MPRRIEAPVLIDEKVGSKGTRQKEKKSKMIELRYGTRNNHFFDLTPGNERVPGAMFVEVE